MRFTASRARLALGALFVAGCTAGGGESTGPFDAATPPNDVPGTVPSDAGVRVDARVSFDAATAAVPDTGAPPSKPGIPIDAGATIPATIAIDPTTRSGTIPAGFIGLSYEKTQLTADFFTGTNAPLIAIFGLLGHGLLRIGGNAVDRTEWYSAPTSDASAAATITQAEVDALSAFARATGWSVLYGLDMKLSSPSVAADEAKYAASSLGSSLAGFEIGNEPDLYTSTAASATWSYSTFKTQWASFASSIRSAAGQTTVLTGPATAANYGTWTVPFAADEGSQIGLLTQHYYRGNGQLASSTVSELLTLDTNLDTELDALSRAATSAGIAGGYRLSECNSYYNGGAPNVSDAFGTALWVIDFLFQNAAHGSSGVNLHGGGDGPGYTPIADANGAVVSARPELYGALLVALAGEGPLYKTTVTVFDSLNVTAYAIGLADGSTSVVIVSKDATKGVHATIDLGAPVTAAGVTYLQGPSLDATTGVTIGGAEIDPAGTFSPTGRIPLAVSGMTVTVDVPAASAALIHVE